MKILIFNWQDIRHPLAGGAEVHMHEIFERIVKMGNEVTLYCSHFEGASKEENVNGIRVIREGGRYLFNFRVFFKYLTRFRHEQYDIVVDNMNKIPFFSPLFVHRPLYMISHHLFGKSIFMEVPWPIAVYVYIMEKAGYRLCKASHTPFIVVSPSTRDELLSIGIPAKDIEIVYNCVDHKVHRRDEQQRSRTPLIGYFGRIKKYKSVEHLLYAFANIVPQMPDLKLVIVGEGDNRRPLESLARELGISGAVTFTGFVSDEEKVKWLQLVWFVVNTSSVEGWGLTVIEANACGTTVLAANVPGLRDAVKEGETGLLYEYGNIDLLTDRILLLLKDAKLRNSLAAAAYDWAATFDWDTAAQKMIGLLRQRSNVSH